MHPFSLRWWKLPVWFKLSPSNLGTLNPILCLLVINPLCQISQFHSATLMFWMILKNGLRLSKKVGKKKVKRKKVLFIEASCSGSGASSSSSCYFTLTAPLPPLAQVQLNVDFNASESTQLIRYMINCQRHGWPYGTEKASSNSYFCIWSFGPCCFNVQERASIAQTWCLALDSPLRNLKAPSWSYAVGFSIAA